MNQATEARVEELTARIEQATKDFTSSDEWKAYLRHAAKFHRYSVNNQLLIWVQAAHKGIDASQANGFKSWLEKGRCVRKGESALWIYAPMVKRDKETGESEVFGFKLVPVFDVAQTDVVEGFKNPYMPLEPKNAGGDEGAAADLYRRLMDVALAVGVTGIKELTTGHRARGCYDPRDKTISIRGDLGVCDAAMTLAHEIAHHLTGRPAKDNDAMPTRDQAELICESVAYIVASLHGIEADIKSAQYITTWQDGNYDVSFEKGMKLIQGAAKQIVDALQKTAAVAVDEAIAA